MLPVGSMDPGSDFVCRRCGHWVFSSPSPCQCADGPLQSVGSMTTEALESEATRANMSAEPWTADVLKRQEAVGGELERRYRAALERRSPTPAPRKFSRRSRTLARTTSTAVVKVIAFHEDRPRRAIVEADFIAYAETPTVHDGKPYWLRQCFELLDGRWEGFVSMRDRRES